MTGGAEREALAQLISSLDVADLTAEIATRGGLLRRDYGRSYGVGLNDALIAATAMELDLQSLTLNVKFYPAVDKQQMKKAYSKARAALIEMTNTSEPYLCQFRHKIRHEPNS